MFGHLQGRPPFVIIDAHCHIGPDRDRSLSAEQLLRQMDEFGVDVAVVCPMDRHIAVDNAEGNALILEAQRAHPDRLVGFATANPWYGERAVQTLRGALGEGLRGLKLNSFVQGFTLNDELAHPLVDVCEEYGVPIYCHTGTACSAMPLQLLELARTFPDVTFLCGHCGYPDFWYDSLPAAQLSPNILLETSHFMPACLEPYTQELGGSRVCFGSNSPWSDLMIELEKVKRLDISEADRVAVLGGNLASLLKLGET